MAPPILAVLLVSFTAFAGAQEGGGSDNPANVGADGEGTAVSEQQPKRILGMVPNYRVVGPGELAPPPTPKVALEIATQNTFDYSAFITVGLTSAIAEGESSYPQIGTGLSGYWGYYWRAFVRRTDGNYLLVFVMPTIFHQDERYYVLGEGSIWKRAAYAASRVLITPNYQGHNSFNASELVGRGIGTGVSATYYPGADRTLGGLATEVGYAVMRDSLTNVFREFWPDVAHRVLHRHR
jgi:hypothetical protein